MQKNIKLLLGNICFILLFINSNTVYTQDTNNNFHELNIHGVLFNKKVNTLFEDSAGYLWIGTNSGLYKYDGYSLTQYQHDVFDSYSLPNNNISSIIEDKYHNLWLGSESYLIHFNIKKNTFTGFYKNVTSSVLGISKKGNIWVNLRSHGLISINPKLNIKDQNLPESYYSGIDHSLYKIKENNIQFIQDDFNRKWIGSSKGILLLDTNKKTIQSNFTKKTNSINLYGNNQIIAATDNGFYILGYNKSNTNLEILESYPSLLNKFNLKGTLTKVIVNPNNNDLWIGTTNGLIKAERNNNQFNFNLFSQENNNQNNHITSFIFDTYGNLWIGSFKGINKYLGRTSLFAYKTPINNEVTPNNITTSIYYETPHNILVGMKNGLYRYNSNKNIFKKINLPIYNVNVITHNYEKTQLFISNQNTLYSSDNYKQTSNKIKLNKIKSYNYDIKDVIAINKNEIWVALWGKGIDIINHKTNLTAFKKRIIQQLKNKHTSVFLLTSENKLWVGTRGEGLYLIDLNNETIEQYVTNRRNGLTSNAILCLHEDRKGDVWVGTRGGGLNIYNKKLNLFKNFKNTKGNIPKIISNIQEDLDGNIWVSTHDGITRYDFKTQKFINFGIEDGINENHFVFNSSATNRTKNILFFGGTDGFYNVFPKKFNPKKITPTTVITNFSAIGTTGDNSSSTTFTSNQGININTDTTIVLPYNQNNISVNFSSLDLTTPSKNEYAYKLKGLNNYWIYTNAFNRNANYNDLPSGSYTFMVKSSNSDGIWNDTPTEVKFIIEPPFFKSKIAFVLYFILLSIILYISSILIKRWYKLKENLVKETISREKDNEHNQMKVTFFTDISHELRTPLSLIFGTIEKVVKEKNFTLSPTSSQRIYNNTLRMQRLINQIMDIRKFDEGKFKLKISKNDIVKDINTIKNAFNDFADTYKIKYSFITKEEELFGWYDVDFLEKILFNLLSNAFKYTKENGEISVSLDVLKIEDPYCINSELLTKGTYIKCSVRDNGVGIPEEELKLIFDRYYQATASQKNQIPGTGIGMELVQKLIIRHHGIITVESTENVSTTFTFYLPINKKRYPKKERVQTGEPLKKNFIKSSEYQVIKEVKPEKTSTTSKNKTSEKPTILIVEDHDDLRTMVKEELKNNFTVIEATNGKEGYEIALKEEPQLIISDILMPIEDGLSMLKKLKQNSEVKNIPVFMLTAKNSEETKIECLSLGANDYIEKPFSLEFLKWKVINTFSTRTVLKEKYSKLITTAPSDVKVDSNDEKFIKKLIQIIEDNMNNNLLNVEFLAAEIGMSRANLYRKVQAILNVTPVNFIKSIKLKRAVQLLDKNQMYISEVAYMTGFNNQKYFSKCFHKEYGMSPTEYMKQKNKEKEE